MHSYGYQYQIYDCIDYIGIALLIVLDCLYLSDRETHKKESILLYAIETYLKQ